MTKRAAFPTLAAIGGLVQMGSETRTVVAYANLGFSELSNGRGGTNLEAVAYTEEKGFDKK